MDSSVGPRYAEILGQRRDGIRDQLERILTPHAEFVWEVGCGHGHFLAAYAAAHPGSICVGVDVVSERIERAMRKRDRARLANLHFLRADARLFLQALPLGPRILDVFILFPDPWPKLRHHKHRVLQPDFLAAVAARCRPGCRLAFRTDFRPYFEDAEKVVRASPHWELQTVPWPFEFETVFQRRATRHDSLVAQLRAAPP
jgi:tRNA (guanine-N7-)-methyltransferase